MLKRTKPTLPPDPQWPSSWGRKGSLKPVIIASEAGWPIFAAVVCLVLALYAGLFHVLSPDSTIPLATTTVLFVLAAIGLSVYQLFTRRPKLIITKLGVHQPIEGQFVPWSEVAGLYVGHDMSRPLGELYSLGRPRALPTCLVYDVKVPTDQRNEARRHHVSFAPNQPQGTDRHYHLIKRFHYSPDQLREAIKEQFNA